VKRQFAVLLVIIASLGCTSFAQSPVAKAWTILDAGVKDSNDSDRATAVRVLGLIQNDKKAREQAELALQDKDSIVRVAGANALRQMHSVESIAKLKELLKDKESPVVLAAANALKNLGDPTGYEVFYAILTGERKSGAGLLDDQKKMLSDPKKMAQFGFEQGIGYIPFASVGIGAIKAFTKDDSSPVRAAAAISLAKDPDPKSGEALVAAAADKKEIVRAAALDAIAQRDDPSLLPGIMAAMDDKEDQVKYTAAAAVIRLSAKQK